MPILRTARMHFAEDIARSRSLSQHADNLPEGILRDDIMRSSWMFAVGALDAFFCDAYADLISRTLRAKELEPTIPIPDKLANLKVPVSAILEDFEYEGWRWRMAARDLIEKDNVLSLEKVKSLFNSFFEDENKLFGHKCFSEWIVHARGRSRMFGVTATVFRASSDQDKRRHTGAAWKKLDLHYEYIFQRRHDCIHNCDRPKMALQRTGLSNQAQVEKIIYDIEFLVQRIDERLTRELPLYLRRHRFNALTRNQVCA